VLEANELGLAEDEAVDERRVILAVGEDDVLAREQRADRTEFDMKPVDQSRTLSVPMKSASSSSSWLWSSSVPLSMRDPVQPVPNSSIACFAAAMTSG
jgi:hypothetical protein